MVAPIPFEDCAYTGSSGLRIEVTFDADISDVTSPKFHLWSPSNLYTLVTATLSGTLKLIYTGADGEFDEVGDWIVQPQFTRSGNVTIHEPSCFRVLAFKQAAPI